MFVVDRKEKTYSLPAKELSPERIKSMTSGLAGGILRQLAGRPMYPAEIAKDLKVHEQKIYYHIRNLERDGIIKIVKKETRQGAIANYYALAEPAFVVRFKDFESTHKISSVNEAHRRFLDPFIVDGRLDALIIVGSPDPHGPDKARSRDGYYGMDLALFLGTFLNYVPKLHVKLDTETREDELRQNLIIVGGPIVNKSMEMFNAKLPIRFEHEHSWNLKSTISNESYPSDECGMIVKAKNQFDASKSVLIVAGKRHTGTRAAIIAFLKHFDEICSGNIRNRKVFAKVVEGVDLDSDGIVDDAEVRE